MGPGDLRKVLSKVAAIEDPRLLVGISGADDAGVVRLSDEVALIQTVDFFTPIVDDPYNFGAIAAANALSDVYAMGGKPLATLNIVCFPSEEMDLDILAAIINGGHSKVIEAGAVPAGGHSILDKDIKYGLAVTGTVHPGRIVSNDKARPGEQLVLTKPVGTGILSTALKGGLISDDEFRPAVETMAALNRTAAEAMIRAGVRAATDITGFGLIVHALEIACASGVGMEIDAEKVPIIRGTIEMAEQGMVPAGTQRNHDHALPCLEVPASMPELLLLVLNDAQTSGGLLMSVPPENLDSLLSELSESGVTHAHIGEVVKEHPNKIRIRYRASE